MSWRVFLSPVSNKYEGNEVEETPIQVKTTPSQTMQSERKQLSTPVKSNSINNSSRFFDGSQRESVTEIKGNQREFHKKIEEIHMKMSTLKKQLQNMNSNANFLPPPPSSAEKNLTLSTRPTTREITNHSRNHTPDSIKIGRNVITQTPPIRYQETSLFDESLTSYSQDSMKEFSTSKEVKQLQLDLKEEKTHRKHLKKYVKKTLDDVKVIKTDVSVFRREIQEIKEITMRNQIKLEEFFKYVQTENKANSSKSRLRFDEESTNSHTNLSFKRDFLTERNDNINTIQKKMLKKSNSTILLKCSESLIDDKDRTGGAGSAMTGGKDMNFETFTPNPMVKQFSEDLNFRNKSDMMIMDTDAKSNKFRIYEEQKNLNCDFRKQTVKKTAEDGQLSSKRNTDAKGQRMSKIDDLQEKIVRKIEQYQEVQNRFFQNYFKIKNQSIRISSILDTMNNNNNNNNNNNIYQNRGEGEKESDISRHSSGMSVFNSYYFNSNVKKLF